MIYHHPIMKYALAPFAPARSSIIMTETAREILGRHPMRDHRAERLAHEHQARAVALERKYSNPNWLQS